jgi:hypothetical protein
MVTAYDTPSARIADDAGVDIILVGDSVAMVVLGYDDTLSVTIDDKAHHTAAVSATPPACCGPGRRRSSWRAAASGSRRSAPSSTPRSPSWATSGSRPSRST